MFGIGFGELLLIAIAAILFLGPDRLPDAMVHIAKTIRSIKRTLAQARQSLEEEIHLATLKEEAQSYRAQLDEATRELRKLQHIDLEDLDETKQHAAADPYAQAPASPSDEEVVTPMETVSLARKKTSAAPSASDGERDDV